MGPWGPPSPCLPLPSSAPPLLETPRGLLLIGSTLELCRLNLPVPRTYRPSPALPPPEGPRGLPLIGSTLQLYGPHRNRHLLAWANTYGPVFRVRTGLLRLGGFGASVVSSASSRDVVEVADPEAAREVLAAADADMAKPGPLCRSFADVRREKGGVTQAQCRGERGDARGSGSRHGQARSTVRIRRPLSPSCARRHAPHPKCTCLCQSAMPSTFLFW